MTEVGNVSKPLSQQGMELADTAATKLMDKASDTVDKFKSNAAHLLDQVSDQAQKLLQQGREVFHDMTQKARERASEASDIAVGYTKDEPIKALLIAATIGAFLMGLISMMARSRA